MRKYLTGGLALALAVALASTVLAATADQTIDGKVTPTKLPKKKFKKATVKVKTTAADKDNPSGIPPKASNAKISLPKNMRFKTDTVPQCTDSLEGTDRTTALALCGNSKVSKDGGSKATAALPLGPGGSRTDVPADVMAFNGPKAGKKPTLILWTRVEAGPLSQTTILEGTLRKIKHKKFGWILNVDIPPLAGGAGALAEFQAKIGKGSYVQARCLLKKMFFKGVFTYTDAPKATATDSHRCKRR